MHAILPKTHRYTIGNRVDQLFTELIEGASVAGFVAKDKKIPYVELAIRKLDTIKIFLMILWETKSLDNKKYLSLAEPVDEIGRMLGGWLGQLNKQNSSA